jgi:TP901 family phage tail tape measure protein
MADSNVGLRLLIIGKDGVLAGLKEVQAATAKMNAEIAAGGKASKVAAAGYAEQGAGLEALGVKMDLYQASLARTAAQTDAVARLGKVAFFTIGAAAAVAGYESIKWATQYQTALVQLRTQAGLTASAVASIGKAAMANAAGLGISPTAYLQAAYHPASTGMSTAETIAITNKSAMLAQIGHASVEDTTNSLTGVMKSYGMGAGQTTHTAALLNAIVGAGNMHYSDLNAALSSGVASTAKTFGVSLSSLGSALAFSTDRGVPAAQAGTRLRMAMSLLGAPSAESSKFLTAAGLTSSAASGETSAMSQALSAAGLTTSQLATAQRHGGIAAALQLLHKDLTGNGVSQGQQAAFLSRAFGGGKMGSAIMQMYDNVPGLQQKQSQITKNATTKNFMQDWADTTKTLDFQLKRLGATFETMGTTFGGVIRGPVTEGVKALTDLLGVVDKNKVVVGGLALAVTGVLVPAMGVYLKGALLSTNGAIMTTIGGYKKLLGMQTAEDAGLVTNDAALATNTADQLANDAAKGAKGGAIATIARLLSGKGGAAVGVAATLYGLSKLGVHANSVFNNQKASSIKSAKALEDKIATLKGQMKTDSGGLMGDVESWGPFGDMGRFMTAERVPMLENNTAGIEARDKHQLSQYEAQLKGMQKKDPSGWTRIDGQEMINLNSTIHVNIDGKQVAKAVVKQTKRTASRS